MRKSGVDIQAELNSLSEKAKALDESRVIVGIQKEAGKNAFGATVNASDDMMMIAHVHEFGQGIKPKKAKHLTIPISPKSMGKTARDFNGLFRIKSKAGNLLLVQKDGNGDIEPLFVLKDSVTIPARPFISRGFYEIKNNASEAIDLDLAIAQYTTGKWSLDKLVDEIGKRCVEITIGKMADAKPGSNANYAARKMASGSSPDNLVMTGALRSHISYRKE